MFYNSVIVLAIFTSSICFGFASNSQEDSPLLGNKGVVFEWTTEKTFQLMLTHSDNKDNKMDYWFEKEEKKFHLSCDEFSLNDGEKKTARAYVSVVDHGYEREETDIDDFQVSSCDEAALLKQTVFVSMEGENKYVLSFKDVQGICHQRKITVDASDLTVAVDRQRPTEVRCRRLKIPRTAKGQVMLDTWMNDGTLNDIDYPEEGVQKFPFAKEQNCDNCWLFCRQVEKNDKKFSIVDIVVNGLPIDRVKTTSCTKYSVKSSITLDFFGQKHGRIKHFYINFLDTKGVCFSRTYEFDQQNDQKNHFIKHLNILRGELKDGNGCFKMKARGFLRQVGKKGVVIKHKIKSSTSQFNITGQLRQVGKKGLVIKEWIGKKGTAIKDKLNKEHQQTSGSIRPKPN